MIITKAYATRLVLDGKATIITTCLDNEQDYIVLNRHDIDRTDHAKVSAEMAASYEKQLRQKYNIEKVSKWVISKNHIVSKTQKCEFLQGISKKKLPQNLALIQSIWQ